MGLFDGIKSKLEAKKDEALKKFQQSKDEALKKFQESKNEALKKFQDQRDEVLKKVSALGDLKQQATERKERIEEIGKKPIERMQEEDFNFISSCAAKGDAEAQFITGRYFESRKDYTKCAVWYTKAAEQGHVDAQYNLGNCYYSGIGLTKDYSKAVEWYTKAAEQGHVDAQYNLGVCFANGRGVTKDYSKAVEWYTNAAEQGVATAQGNLANCYLYGRGVTKDYSKAIEWFTKAAKQGFAEAQYNLGAAYENGEGVTRDCSKAIEWYAKAAKQGFAEAQKALRSLKQRISKEEAERKAREEAERKAREEAERKAREEAERKAQEEAERKAREEAERKAREEAERKAEEERKAREEAERKAEEERKLNELIPKAENGDAQAACQLGMWFQHGENGITKNIDKAIYWYQKAAMHGNPSALTFINIALEEKKKQDEAKLKAQEEVKRKDDEEAAKRALYDTEDEYLANEKRDGDAARRVAFKFMSMRERTDNDDYESRLRVTKIIIRYLNLAKEYDSSNDDYLFNSMIEGQTALARDLLKLLKMKEEIKNKVYVRIFYKTDRMSSSTRQDVALDKEEYYALLSGGEKALKNYVKSNFLSSSRWDEYVEEVTMEKDS